MNSRCSAVLVSGDVADYEAEAIARKALGIAADIDIYTNQNIVVESL